MTAFDDIMGADALNMVAGEFGESVVYTPASPDVNNQERTINAIVERTAPAPIRAQENWTPPRMVIRVANDAVKGVTPAQLDTGGDTITVSYRRGEGAKPFRVGLAAQGEFCDAGMLVLELR
jgi:hypothetical protein